MLNIIKELNDLLEYCISRQISDIHLESLANAVRVRVRSDGLLKELRKFPKDDGLQCLARLKVMAKLDTNSKLPLDGRFSYGQTAIRISTLPTYWGEKIVLRILQNNLNLLEITKLGLPEAILQKVTGILKKSSGLILITGPTGSGKTTTLYSLLKLLNSSTKNIVTIEDPIEYQFDTLNQVQVNRKSGLSFSNILQHILRQDPDIIFIGEIRDSETAELTFRAALTGHLVLATLHNKNSQETLLRLKDLGINEFLIRHSINCIVAQRLFRKFCSSCNGTGCPECDQSGYRGRSGIFEYYDPDQNFIYTFDQARQDILQQGLTSAEELAYLF